jgi:formylglycine-generating enzyme required for sulfatase activity
MSGGGVTFEMMLIPPGKFWMGSPEGEKGRFDREGPCHRVLISKGFWLGKYEVTQGQWYSVTGEKPWSGESWAKENPKHAASNVSWDDIKKKLLSKLGGGFGLPSEAQWEYACRAGTLARFYWGEDKSDSEIGRYAWYDGNAWDKGEKYAHAVGQKAANAWGLYDMSGNVYEWCRDDMRDYSSGEQIDPVGSSSGAGFADRGGRWGNFARYCRLANRNHYSSDSRYNGLGFRLQVMTAF